MKVLEHPGLWNGGMSGWLTRFVEIPSFCFQPVKVRPRLDRSEVKRKRPEPLERFEPFGLCSMFVRQTDQRFMIVVFFTLSPWMTRKA